MTDDEQVWERQARTITAVSADSVAELRACDLHRVIMVAADQGRRDAYIGWLICNRPDIHDRIVRAVRDLQEEGNI